MSRFDKTLGGIQSRRRVLTDSVIPPPPKEDEFRPGPAPRGTRTPALQAQPPELEGLPDHAPGWMKRARRLSIALETAISGGQVDPVQLVALERAFAAYEMSGTDDETIVTVSHLCERAHTAIRERFRDGAQRAYEDCAQVLHAGLPRAVRRAVEVDDVVPVVREMRSEADPWVAVVNATSKLLGWDGRARAHAAQAIRAAIDASRAAIDSGRG